MRSLVIWSVSSLLACAACDRGAPRDARDTGDTGDTSPRAIAPTGCYRSPASVLGRTTPLDGHSSVAPGWLRFDRAAAGDSGTVRLVDADGGFFEARWRRGPADSIAIEGADDFMRLAVRVALMDSVLSGAGDLTSDAELQRDSSGQLQPLHRMWGLLAAAVSCDSIPKPAS